MSNLKFNKVSTIPVSPAPPNEVFYVQNGTVHDQYITDSFGNVLPLTKQGYSTFPVWAEESATLSTNNNQWSYGNGDTGAIGIVVDTLEVYAMSIDADIVGTSVDIELMRDGITTTTASFTGANEYIELTTAIPYSQGQLLGFRTGTVTGTFNSVRVTAWCRMPLQGLKGEKGDDGADGVPSQFATWQLQALPDINDTVFTSLPAGTLLMGAVTGASVSGNVINLPAGSYIVHYNLSLQSTIQRANQQFVLNVTNGISLGVSAPFYIRGASGHDNVGSTLTFPVVLNSAGSVELQAIREAAGSGTTVVQLFDTLTIGGTTVPVSYVTVQKLI